MVSGARDDTGGGMPPSNEQLRSGVSDGPLAEMVMALRDEDRLCVVHGEEEAQEPKIICSMGLIGRDDSRTLDSR